MGNMIDPLGSGETPLTLPFLLETLLEVDFKVCRNLEDDSSNSSLIATALASTILSFRLFVPKLSFYEGICLSKVMNEISYRLFIWCPTMAQCDIVFTRVSRQEMNLKVDNLVIFTCKDSMWLYNSIPMLNGLSLVFRYFP